ncbi:VOC family protein [Acuticoccus kandeliae]|uniref:VOC family protein n=1 Tax=Acuticoccus kandeliae TaxID=2073160 RepID=UPI000D3E8473|nr:VOC family protein [Acuticoccus kandeliae]
MAESIPAIQASAYLHHVAMESPDPERLAAFYGTIMQMRAAPASAGEWRCEGPARRFVAVKGAARKMAYAGLACRDEDAVRGLRAYAEKNGLEVLASPSPYFGNEAFAVRDPDGHLICFGTARSQERSEGLHAPTQHLTFASFDVEAFRDFYHDKLGFAVSDIVVHPNGSLATCFTRSNHEHHTIACFKSNRMGVDHHSYEAGDWDRIRDWCDHFAAHDVTLMWGPGRHGPGNNLFVFIEDPDGNWIEVSAELEIIHDRQVQSWPHEARTLNRWGDAILRS